MERRYNGGPPLPKGEVGRIQQPAIRPCDAGSGVWPSSSLRQIPDRLRHDRSIAQPPLLVSAPGPGAPFYGTFLVGEPVRLSATVDPTASFASGSRSQDVGPIGCWRRNLNSARRSRRCRQSLASDGVRVLRKDRARRNVAGRFRRLRPCVMLSPLGCFTPHPTLSPPGEGGPMPAPSPPPSERPDRPQSKNIGRPATPRIRGR
jgi:hypothetical protein